MLKIEDKIENAHKFLNYVSTKKREMNKWSYLHVKINEGDNAQKYFGEISQFLEFQFQDDASYLFKHEQGLQLVLVTSSKNAQGLMRFDKNVQENFPADSIQSTTNSFRDGRVTQFSNVFEQILSEQDTVTQIVFQRMKRTTNTIMVLDDDEMILRQFEKILSRFGTVVPVKNHKYFLEEYKKHAPNILFMDVHLGEVRGPAILDVFFQKFDPYAHVIVISGDSKKSIVQEAGEKGAKGFVVKPFGQHQIIEHVMKSSTFCSKN